jgi:5-methylcytosine-specific restriction endonuclease McrA
MKTTREIFFDLVHKSYGEFDHRADEPLVNIANLLSKLTRDVLRKMPYAEYLKTEHWREVRERALRLAGHKCDLCSKTQYLRVHHRTYEHRGFEFDEDVRVLCDDCHKTHHNVMPEPPPDIEIIRQPRNPARAEIHDRLAGRFGRVTDQEAVELLKKLQEMPG